MTEHGKTDTRPDEPINPEKAMPWQPPNWKPPGQAPDVGPIRGVVKRKTSLAKIAMDILEVYTVYDGTLGRTHALVPVQLIDQLRAALNEATRVAAERMMAEDDKGPETCRDTGLSYRPPFRGVPQAAVPIDAIRAAREVIADMHERLTRTHPSDRDDEFSATTGRVNKLPELDGHCAIAFCKCTTARAYRALSP